MEISKYMGTEKGDLPSKHGGVRPAPHDVVLVEHLVKGDRLRKPLHRICHALLEPPTPELHLLFRWGFGRGDGARATQATWLGRPHGKQRRKPVRRRGE